MATVPDSPVHASAPPYRLLLCPNCDVVFSDPVPCVSGDWYVGQVMYAIRDHLTEPVLQWNHRQFLKDLPAKGGLLLDVGCGTGGFLAVARQEGYTVEGLDFDPEAVRMAQERFGLNDVFTGNVDEFLTQRPRKRYDVVTAFEVLEHTTAPREFIRELVGLLAPGGYLALSVPNRERRPAFDYDWDCPPHHLTRWSASALVSLLERSGLQVKRIATGWCQGEPLLHQLLQFGLVSRLVGSRQDGAAGNHDRSLAAASLAYRLKHLAVKALAVPVNAVLSLVGDTGMNLYVLAERNER